MTSRSDCSLIYTYEHTYVEDQVLVAQLPIAVVMKQHDNALHGRAL